MSCPSSTGTARSSSAFLSTAPGVTRRSRTIASCISRCWRISSRRARSPNRMAPAGMRGAEPIGRCSCSTEKGRSRGATARRSRSIPARTASWTRSRRCLHGRTKMAKLRVPVTPRDHILGDDNAPVTVVEYGDYECPHCAAAQPIVADILLRLGDRLRFVYRHFPLVEIHPIAGPAAETAEVAGSRGHFWQMHQSIFANQPRLSVTFLITLAANLKLSPVDLRDALAAGGFAEKGPG